MESTIKLINESGAEKVFFLSSHDSCDDALGIFFEKELKAKTCILTAGESYEL